MTDDNKSNRKWYTTECNGTQFTLPVRYHNLSRKGQGAYGFVVGAIDNDTEEKVAIKKMLKPFESPTYSKRTYRELKLLMHLNHPDAQVIQLYDVFTPDKNVEEFNTLYFVFDYVDYDLHRVIRFGKPFTENHIKHIVYSLLRGLKFIHSAGILHRDLKPSNIGIDQNSNISILDFGLSRVALGNDFTDYVATRWWRAPEVYTNEKNYNEKLDIWSVGCIMAELILLRPLFRGSDHIDQLNKILNIVGTPDEATLNAICTPNLRDYINGLEHKSKDDFQQLFGYKYDPVTKALQSGVSITGVDLIDRLLTFDYRKRPTVEEAITHPFLEIFHNSTDEPTAELIVDEHENKNYSIDEWKSIVWQMIYEFQSSKETREN